MPEPTPKFDTPKVETAAEKDKREIKEYVLGELKKPVSPERKTELNQELATVSDFFRDAGIDCFVAGGSGLDLVDGEWDRDHQDLDMAIFDSNRRAFFEAAIQRGYLVTNYKRESLTIENIENPETHNAFIFRSDANGVSQFEVMFMNELPSGELKLNEHAHAPRELFVGAPKHTVEEREIKLQPPEIILFYKLADGRRKDCKDIVQTWEALSDEQRQRIQTFVHDAKFVFEIDGEDVSGVSPLLEAAKRISSQKTEQFFSQDIERIDEEAGKDLMEKCDEVFSVRSQTPSRESFFEALSEKYQGFMPEPRAVIEAMSDFLYQEPAPSIEDFKHWAKKYVKIDERIKKMALHEYVSQPLWKVRTAKPV